LIFFTFSLGYVKDPVFSYRFATNPNPEAWIKSIFSNKPFPTASREEKLSKPEIDNTPPDYWEMAKSLENASSIDKTSFLKNLKEIHQAQ